ncbi:hypothetical protein [Streptomyces sp. NRRL B-24484]|uniref:hypothetical protein n=1 Tax=Streptomyces sp. NRRL B-24484 TaxID=1463833 RepID=UPI0004C0785F|nr:hypothetical protein [Streptomyces sp. NRRL B-24484]
MARPAARTAPVLIALLALAAGCSSAPAPAPAPGTAGDTAVTAPAPSTARPGTAPWRSLAALSPEQLTDLLLSGEDLPPGITSQPAEDSSEGGADAVAATARQYPACAPVLALFSEEESVGRYYHVTGNNVLGGLTRLGLLGAAGGRERYDALASAVYGGGCTGFRLASGPQVQVEAVGTEGLEAPAVGFRIVTATGAQLSPGGVTRDYLYAAVGDNRALFLTADDTANAPVLRADLVNAQIHRLVAAASAPGAGASAGH